MKKVVVLSLILGLSSFTYAGFAHPAKQVSKAASHIAVKTTTQDKGILDPSYKSIDPLTLLQDPGKLIGEKFSFEATFSSFNPYAVDYKGAMRSSKDYVAFLIQRPDVTSHDIPLSELKLIYSRKKAEKDMMNVETGDKLLIQGKVFSAALGDSWMDVTDVTLVKKGPEHLAKDAHPDED